MRHHFKWRRFVCASAVFFMLLVPVPGLLYASSPAQAAMLRATIRDGDVGGADIHNQDLRRQVLPKNDGWASADGGTTGGAAATNAHVHTVTNREELVKALGGDNSGADTTPKIITIKGVINGNEDDTGKALTCSDYITDGYSLDAYLKAYDPSVWGRTSVPSGALEDARKASQLKQAARVVIYIPSNTTIIGSEAGARVIGANFMLKGANNVIIRNIQLENAADCFPQWDPTDGSTGNWNSQYDNVSVVGSTHVWMDHDSFTDADHPDSSLPSYFGRLYEQHDGELDITKGSDLVTASWNRFADHDKTMLIGSTDSPTYDVGKLRVTVHHNEFENVVQRLPRVRYGQVHVYNNYYSEATNAAFLYALGVGISSQIFAQNNYYSLPSSFATSSVISVFKGTMIHSEGDLVNGKPVDLLAAYNAANDPDLSGNVGWTPQYHLQIDATRFVPDLARRYAGASHTIRVSQDGKGDFSSVQAALNAVPINNAANTTIALKAGTYREVVNLPASKPYITLLGGTLRPEDTVITYDNWSGSPAPGGGTLGTSGSATATFVTFHFALQQQDKNDTFAMQQDRFAMQQDLLCSAAGQK